MKNLNKEEKVEKVVTRAAWNKNKEWSDEVKSKISNTFKIKKIKPAYHFPKGNTPWNKGKSWSKEVRQKLSLSLRGRKAWNKGQKWDEEAKLKISESRKGQASWNTGLKWNQEVKDKIKDTIAKKKEVKSNDRL